MDIIIVPILKALILMIDLYLKVIFISVIISWLVGFGIINTSNRFVFMAVNFFRGITEPLFRKIERFVPPINGISLSPMVLIIGVIILRDVLIQILTKM